MSTEEDAKKWIGGSLVPILNNLALADKKGVRTVLRCPIIPGVNDNTAHLQTICDLLGRYPSIEQAQLLPYHRSVFPKEEISGSFSRNFRFRGKKKRKIGFPGLNKMEKKKENGWFWNTRDRECAEDSVKFLAHSL